MATYQTTFFTGTGSPITMDQLPGDTFHTPWDDVLHRGWNAGVPDNTLPAFYLIRKNGFSWGECDLRMSSDKQVILAHDNTVRGILDGTETTLTVPESTASEICSLVLQTHDTFGDIHPCTLAEVLELAKIMDINLVLDIKNASNTINNEEFHKILAATVVASGWATHVIYMPTGIQSAKWIQEVDRNASFDFVSAITAVDKLPADFTEMQSLLTGANTVGYDFAAYADMDEEIFTRVHEAGLSVSFWNVNNTNFFKFSPLRITYTGTGNANLGRNYIRQKQAELAAAYPTG